MKDRRNDPNYHIVLSSDGDCEMVFMSTKKTNPMPQQQRSFKRIFTSFSPYMGRLDEELPTNEELKAKCAGLKKLTLKRPKRILRKQLKQKVLKKLVDAKPKLRPLAPKCVQAPLSVVAPTMNGGNGVLIISPTQANVPPTNVPLSTGTTASIPLIILPQNVAKISSAFPSQNAQVNPFTLIKVTPQHSTSVAPNGCPNPAKNNIDSSKSTSVAQNGHFTLGKTPVMLTQNTSFQNSHSTAAVLPPNSITSSGHQNHAKTFAAPTQSPIFQTGKNPFVFTSSPSFQNGNPSATKIDVLQTQSRNLRNVQPIESNVVSTQTTSFAIGKVNLAKNTAATSQNSSYLNGNTRPSINTVSQLQNFNSNNKRPLCKSQSNDDDDAHNNVLIKDPTLCGEPLDFEEKRKLMITLELKCPEDGCRVVIENNYLTESSLKDAIKMHLTSVHKLHVFNRCMACLHPVPAKAMLDHIGVEHGNISQFICLKCSKPFASYASLCKHMYLNHMEGRFKCDKPNCPFVATTRINVYRHNSNDHRASICTATGYGQALNNNNAGQQRFLCTFGKCTYSAKNKDVAVQHVRTKHFRLPPTRNEQMELRIEDNRDANAYIKPIVRTKLCKQSA